ncbi:hypothetical protein [Streptomyces sp. NPDC048650]|uniref:hypothetical protein n=1 Tax=Streptomyces sp. NPDC048650 TaxID=3365583 RepID=UPI00371F02C7
MIDDQVPDSLPVRDDAPPVTGSDVGRILIGLLVLAFAGVTGLFAPLLVMASDGCNEGDARTICSAGAQQIVGNLPVGAAFVAAVLTVVGMSNRGNAGWGCLLAAPCLLAVAWVVSLAIVGA